MSEIAEKDDVSKEFFEACEKLKIGELAVTSDFRMIEAMSSIELMDPKMDLGMRKLEEMGLQVSIDMGLYEDDTRQQLAIIDATFAMLVGWLEGDSLSQTLWTNVLLAEADKVTHYLFSPFANGLIHVINLVTHVITTSCTFEEEDFNLFVPYVVETQISREIAIKNLRTELSKLAEKASRTFGTRKEIEDSKVLLAIGARLEIVCLILEILTWLTPPPRVAVERSSRSSADDEDIEEEEDEEVQDQFRPNFNSATLSAKRLEDVTQTIASTYHLGSSAPDNGDGNYSWLPAFAPDLNRRHLPTTFPRKVTVPSRKDGLRWLARFAKRLHIISSNAERSASDLSSLFFFARSFNISDSCVLTRSVLQLVMFPVNERICGNPEYTIADPIEASLKDMFAPMVLQKESVVFQDVMCKKLYNIFLNSMAKVALSVYQIFGCNLARQRDRLVSAIEELGHVQIDASRVELRTEQVMRSNEISEVPHHSVSTFVFHNLLSLVSHYFELSFRMDLFVPYEFTYIYWYMGDILSRWQINTLERSQEMLMQGWRMNPLSQNVNPRKTKEKQRAEEQLRRRLQLNQYHIIYQFSLLQMSEGVVKLTVALIKMGKLKVPIWNEDTEKLRYERRMEPFEPLGNPLFIEYEQYQNLSRINETFELPTSQLIDQAIESFESSKSNLEKLIDKVEVREDSGPYLKAAKSNWIGAKLIKMQDMSNRKIEWIYPNDSTIFPQIKIS